jgi:cell division protein FtsB
VRVFIALLLLVALYLQYALWFQRGGVRDVDKLRAAVAEQGAEIQLLRDRNQALAAEVIDLKQGLEAIEERARSDMGMIKEDEVFFRTNEPQDNEIPAANE